MSSKFSADAVVQPNLICQFWKLLISIVRCQTPCFLTCRNLSCRKFPSIIGKVLLCVDHFVAAISFHTTLYRKNAEKINQLIGPISKPSSLKFESRFHHGKTFLHILFDQAICLLLPQCSNPARGLFYEDHALILFCGTIYKILNDWQVKQELSKAVVFLY